MALESERWRTEAKTQRNPVQDCVLNGRYWNRMNDNLLARENVKRYGQNDQRSKSLARSLIWSGITRTVQFLPFADLFVARIAASQGCELRLISVACSKVCSNWS